MWTLLLSTILTSAADCLNPFAITQQFVLQGMVKKPKHIWFFIIPTGVVNLIGGFLAYFGLASLIKDAGATIFNRYGNILLTAELIAGIAFLIGVCYIIQNKKLEALKTQMQTIDSKVSTKDDEAEAVNKIKSVSPAALVALGAGATISELTTALPYFAFLTILFNYKLSLVEVSLILILYNIIYTSPLILLYFIYLKAQNKFDRIYELIKNQITKWSNIAAPSVASIIGIFLVYHSMSLLFR